MASQTSITSLDGRVPPRKKPLIGSRNKIVRFQSLDVEIQENQQFPLNKLYKNVPKSIHVFKEEEEDVKAQDRTRAKSAHKDYKLAIEFSPMDNKTIERFKNKHKKTYGPMKHAPKHEDDDRFLKKLKTAILETGTEKVDTPTLKSNGQV